MRRLWLLARRYGFDALIVLVAAESTLEVVLLHGSPQAPRAPLWFAVPATALIVVPLLARRRFPIAAPVAVWLVAAVLSFVDGRLVVFPAGIYIAGLAAAFLLGNSAGAGRARLGLAVVLAGAAIIIHNDPRRDPDDLK